ncbi:1,4-dihydroxy-2-naphthoate prenyltransferase, partial [Agromyces sp. MMS17-SY077]|nr:1,4-dihydroxy-2-naphthoate prenyltransferase [Agromyces seonyuensis]
AVAVVAGAVAVLLGGAGGDLAGIPVASWACFAGAVAASAATFVLALSRPPSRALFRLVMLAALLLAAQLVLTGRALAG